MTDNWWVALRAVLMMGGTMLATMGYMKAEDVVVFGAHLDVVVPAGVAFAGFMWGQWVRFRTRAVPIKTAMRADVPTVSPATGALEPGPHLADKASGV